MLLLMRWAVLSSYADFYFLACVIFRKTGGCERNVGSRCGLVVAVNLEACRSGCFAVGRDEGGYFCRSVVGDVQCNVEWLAAVKVDALAE
jgi:hypothetical protein